MPTTDRSISEVLHDILGNVQEIVRSEVRLAKTEIRVEAGKAKAAGLLSGAGAVTGFYAGGFLLLAIVYALAAVMPNWAAALIVGFVLAVVSWATLSAGARRFKQVHPAPPRTVETLKENVQWVRQHSK